MLWKLSCIALWSFMLWQFSYIAIWSLMLWKTFTHYPVEIHALATLFLVGLDLSDLGKILHLCAGHTFYCLNTSLFGSDTPTYGFKQHNPGSNNTFITSKQHFPHFKTLSQFKQFLLYSKSINSLFFFYHTNLFQNNFLSFHKRTIIICSLAIRLKA